MKRTFKLFLFCLFGLVSYTSNAQKYYYHNKGDTLGYLDSIYWRPSWYDNYLSPDTISPHNAYELSFPLIGAGEVLMKCYTEDTIYVIGIAGMAMVDSESPVDTLRRKEEFRLYQAFPNDSLDLKLSFQYDLKDASRALYIREKNLPTHCCDSMIIDSIPLPIYEYYTDNPVCIVDTFYIGGTTYSLSDSTSFYTYPNFPRYICATSYWYNLFCPECRFPEVDYRFTFFYNTFTGLPAHTVYKFKERQLMYTFPILLIDTSFSDTISGTYVCPEVKNFRAASTWESGGTLLWNAEVQHCMWQLRLCNADGDLDNPLIDTLVHTAYFTFGGLQPETHYDVYIRAYCEHYGDTLESDWSEPVDLYTIFQNTAIDQPSDALVQLMPNPAGDHVQVVSCFPLRSVELYDLQGQRVLSQSAEGVSTVLDVSRLSRGTYIAVIRNQGGTSTKKLILQ